MLKNRANIHRGGKMTRSPGSSPVRWMGKMVICLRKPRGKLLAALVFSVVVTALVAFMKLSMPKLRYANEMYSVEVVPMPQSVGTEIPSGLTIGIVCAVTTRQQVLLPTTPTFAQRFLDYLKSPTIPAKNYDQLETNAFHKMPLFVDLLPSFCRTASARFTYRFYVSYDFDDPILSTDEGRNSFESTYSHISKEHCWDLNVDAELKLVVSNSSGQPARAQSDAVMAAYRDNVDYYYRVNDDTRLETLNWSEAFVRHLLNAVPQNVGVVGPTCQDSSSLNNVILTYEFLHRIHVEIFGRHYPTVFRAWWADNWITHVYQPGRAWRLSDVIVYHTLSVGQRYVSGSKTDPGTLDDEIRKGRKLVQETVGKFMEQTNDHLPSY